MTSRDRRLRRTLPALLASGVAVFSQPSFGQYSAAAYAGSEYPFAATTTPGEAAYTHDGTGAAGTVRRQPSRSRRTVTVAAVPEAGRCALMLAGLAALGAKTGVKGRAELTRLLSGIASAA